MLLWVRGEGDYAVEPGKVAIDQVAQWGSVSLSFGRQLEVRLPVALLDSREPCHRRRHDVEAEDRGGEGKGQARQRTVHRPHEPGQQNCSRRYQIVNGKFRQIWPHEPDCGHATRLVEGILISRSQLPS